MLFPQAVNRGWYIEYPFSLHENDFAHVHTRIPFYKQSLRVSSEGANVITNHSNNDNRIVRMIWLI